MGVDLLVDERVGVAVLFGGDGRFDLFALWTGKGHFHLLVYVMFDRFILFNLILYFCYKQFSFLGYLNLI